MSEPSNTLQDSSAGAPEKTSTSKSLAENLYKRSTEILGKNKTLSLLRKLYEISVLTLEPKVLAERIGKTVQVDLGFELVGIFLYDDARKELAPLSFSSSERILAVQSEFSLLLKDVIIPLSHSPFLKKIIETGAMGSTEESTDIWDELVPHEMFAKIRREAHVKSSLVYPLRSGEKTIGALLFSLNRSYNQLLDHEKESIESFINVVAVALDKALLDQELKAANSELATANVRLKELDQQKSEFVSLASHQLRSPLTAIRGYASNMLEGDYGALVPAQKEPIERIAASVQSLVIMVEDFLNVSRIEQGRMKFDFADFDLGKLVQDVIGEQKPTIEKKGLAISYSEEKGKKYPVSADMVKIKQVITNFLDNSVKYTPAGSIKVSIKKDDAYKKITIVISDTGVGISATTLPKLFNKFTRANDANKTNVQGTGLGLYVAKQMIEAHKGRVWAESAGEGKGSSFFIELQGK